MPPSSSGSAASWRAAASSVACSGGLPARPGVPGCCERQLGPLRRGRGQRCRAFVGAPGPRRRRRDVRHGTRRPRARRRRPGRVPRPRRRGATPPGRSRRPRPGRRPGPGGRVAARRRWRPGRGPSAPAGDAPAPAVASTTSSPEATAASRACSSTPRVDAARADDRELAGVVGGRQQQHGLDRCRTARRLRSRKACSTRVDRCSWVGSGADPPSWSALSSAGSSSSASGLPPVSTTSRSVTSGRRCCAQALLEQGPGRGRVEPGQHQLARCRRGGTASRPRRGRRRPGAPGPHRAGGRRTAARPRWRGRASGRPRRRTARASPRPRRSAATASPPPPGTARPRGRPPRRTRRAGPAPAGRGARRAAASPGAAAGAVPRTPTVPRPPGPGCAAPVASPAWRRRVPRGGRTCRRPARRGPPRCRPTRAAPDRGGRPDVRSRARGRLAPCDRTPARTTQPLPNPAL